MGKRIYPINFIRYWYAYDIDEICQLYSNYKLHKQTVRKWIKEGLPVIHRGKPILIYGNHLKKFLGNQNKANKCHTEFGQFFCMKCRDARSPYRKQIQLKYTNNCLQVKAFCRECKNVMHKGHKLDELPKLKSFFHVVEVLELYDSKSPTVNTHLGAPNKLYQSEPIQLELFK